MFARNFWLNALFWIQSPMTGLKQKLCASELFPLDFPTANSKLTQVRTLLWADWKFSRYSVAVRSLKWIISLNFRRSTKLPKLFCFCPKRPMNASFSTRLIITTWLSATSFASCKLAGLKSTSQSRMTSKSLGKSRRKIPTRQKFSPAALLIAAAIRIPTLSPSRKIISTQCRCFIASVTVGRSQHGNTSSNLSSCCKDWDSSRHKLFATKNYPSANVGGFFISKKFLLIM